MAHKDIQQEQTDPCHTQPVVVIPSLSAKKNVSTSKTFVTGRDPGLYLAVDQIVQQPFVRRQTFKVFLLYGNSKNHLDMVEDLYEHCERQMQMCGIRMCYQEQKQRYLHKVKLKGQYLHVNVDLVTDSEQPLNEATVSITQKTKTFHVDEITRINDCLRQAHLDIRMATSYGMDDLPYLQFSIFLKNCPIKNPELLFMVCVTQLDDSKNVIPDSKCVIHFATKFKSSIGENQAEATRGITRDLWNKRGIITEKLKTGIALIIKYLVDKKVLTLKDQQNLQEYNTEDVSERGMLITELIGMLMIRERGKEYFILALKKFGDETNRNLAADLENND